MSAGIVDEETEALRRRRAAGATNAEKQVKNNKNKKLELEKLKFYLFSEKTVRIWRVRGWNFCDLSYKEKLSRLVFENIVFRELFA